MIYEVCTSKIEHESNLCPNKSKTSRKKDGQQTMISIGRVFFCIFLSFFTATLHVNYVHTNGFCPESIERLIMMHIWLSVFVGSKKYWYVV